MQSSLRSLERTWPSGRVRIEGTPVLSREELRRVNGPEDLYKILAERKGKLR